MTIIGFQLANLKKVMSTVDSNAVPDVWDEVHVHYTIAG